jgi:hypothetical protein
VSQRGQRSRLEHLLERHDKAAGLNLNPPNWLDMTIHYGDRLTATQ